MNTESTVPAVKRTSGLVLWLVCGLAVASLYSWLNLSGIGRFGLGWAINPGFVLLFFIGKPPFFDPSAMRLLVQGFGVSALARVGRGEAPTGARQRAANTAGARYPSAECGLASL